MTHPYTDLKEAAEKATPGPWDVSEKTADIGPDIYLVVKSSFGRVVAAQKLLISPFGEIGPLDVQLRQRDELFERRSGLTTRAALADLQTHAFQLFEEYMLGIKARSGGSVSFKLAAEISGHVAAELMSGVYSQINPEALGQDYRDLGVATAYGERLAQFGGNLKFGAIERLVHDYPSHDFVIDQYEAAELFQRVDVPSPELFELMKDHMGDMITPRRTPKLVKMLTPKGESKDETGASHEEASETKTQGEPGLKANGQGHPPEHA